VPIGQTPDHRAIGQLITVVSYPAKIASYQPAGSRLFS
jgi:hypothetical protein